MVAHYPPGATYGPRQMQDFAFVWLLRGSAEWHYHESSGDEHTHLLEPGTLLLVRPGMHHHFRWDREQASVHAFTHFLLDDVTPLGRPETWPLVRTLSASHPMGALCRYLLWLGSTPSGHTRQRMAEVVGWLIDLFVNGPFPDEEDHLPDHLHRLVDQLRVIWHRGQMRPVNLREMADAAGISAGHLARIFRQRFGTGPVAALELIRLARAATLLRRSNLSVAAVANACGYSNAFHFSRRFHVIYGASPRSYRHRTPPDDPLEPVRSAHLLPLAQRLLFEEL